MNKKEWIAVVVVVIVVVVIASMLTSNLTGNSIYEYNNKEVSVGVGNTNGFSSLVSKSIVMSWIWMSFLLLIL